MKAVSGSTVPLTLFTLANLLAAWRSRGEARGWWLGAALLILAERVMTFSYFIPAMVELQGGGLPGPEAVEAATRWGQLSYLRHALTLADWLAALNAFSLRGSRVGEWHSGRRVVTPTGC